MAKKFKKNILIALLALSVVASLVPPIAPAPKASAAVSTYETNPIPIEAEVATEINTLDEYIQQILEWAESFLLAELKKRLLDRIVDQVIQWIQGGGDPQFVTDWQGFLEDAGQAAVGDFAQELGLGFLCNPFSLQVQITLLPVKRFSQRVTCTLDQIVGNIENFYSDFRNGGWLAFNQSLAPQNNYFGTVLIGAAERQIRVDLAEQEALNEAESGSGFLSTKECDEDGTDIGTDVDRDGKRGDIRSTCVVNTPGTTVAQLTTKALGTDIDYILSADQLEEYVTAIVNAAINRLITEGLGSLTQSGDDTTVRVSCDGLAGNALQDCLDYINSTQNSFSDAKTVLANRIGKSLTARQEAQTFLLDSEQRIINYIPALENLISSFNDLKCKDKDLFIDEVRAELAFATSTLPSIENLLPLNQAAIDELIIVTDKVAVLADSDWSGLTDLSTEINRLNIASSAAAVQIRADAESQNKDLIARIANKLQRFNDNLDICDPSS